jgi:ankyrin repeat protein
MLAAGMGASATLDRRGVALIDGGRAPGEDLVLRAVEAIAEAGVDVNATNRGGDTALHAAAAAGLDRVVAALIRRGAAINPKNARGQTPLGALLARRAPAADRASTMALLRSLGAAE